ncbi:uncharacterized protein SPSK_06755 [Sporothrix schenckii 1099-18]|uniref:Uncharacterized protein n=1 Tax=Sporothrix schenckii 1099-18 TaxID=1397361 RepID=A0A0F2MJM3_SPOSC|nr:uncharacterized protein SPSK_06755 [Sporothrix schenckii 1099-18]KJR89822.1 hypothetical protein SPSK_06755 [Sporothrix schenckii 1099-18]
MPSPTSLPEPHCDQIVPLVKFVVIQDARCRGGQRNAVGRVVDVVQRCLADPPSRIDAAYVVHECNRALGGQWATLQRLLACGFGHSKELASAITPERPI